LLSSCGAEKAGKAIKEDKIAAIIRCTSHSRISSDKTSGNIGMVKSQYEIYYMRSNFNK
jgi:hypothetical protein